MKHRLQKLLAQANLGSRRATEEFIIAGRVKVNGEVAILGTKADPEVDVVTLDGEKLDLKTPPVYIAYYKPVNVLSTTERQHGDDRPTVREMVPVEGHLFILGRLDVESEGLIILTNDGELTNKLTHPRYEHTKTYQVTVYGHPDHKALEVWQKGIMLTEEDGGEVKDIQTAPCFVETIRREGDTTLLKVVMTEGRNRQIRRVAAALGYPVKLLIRTHIGRFGLGKLKRGDYAEMSEQDLRLLTTPAPELEDIHTVKSQLHNANRRAKYMALTTASPEQIEDAKRNKPAPAPRPGKKYAARDDRGGRDDRPRRSFDRDDRGGRDGDRSRGGTGPRRSGPPDGKRPGSRPAFRSRLMIDETGDSANRPRRNTTHDTPEGFRSRLGEADRPQRRAEGDRSRRPYIRDGEDRPRRPRPEGEGFRSRLSEADRPQRGSSGQGRQFRREGDNRPQRRTEGRGPRAEGERGERSASSDRPRYPRRDGDSRPPRREGDRDSRPPRREGGGDDRPRRPRPEGERGERSTSGDRARRPYNREGGGDSRPPRRDGDSRPPRREGDRDSRPPRREGDRDDRGPRSGATRGSGDDRREQRSSGRPPRRDGDSRPPRREGGERPASGDRPRRPAGDRPAGRTGGGQRDGRPAGAGPRRDRPAGSEGRRPPPRRDGNRSDRPARPAKKREDEE
jgi:23S rRNA pseudouridine2605 synthase